MIGKLSYNQVEQIATELKQAKQTVEAITKNLNIEVIGDFLATVEGYSKYLQTTIEMSKDADHALEELKNRK